MTKARSALSSKNYVRFMNQLNQGLEVLHSKTQAEVTDILRAIFTRVLEIISLRYGSLTQENLLTYRSKQALKDIDNQLDLLFQVAAQQMLAFQVKLNAKAYTLSLIGSAEGIGQATGRPVQYDLPKGVAFSKAVDKVSEDNQASRMELIFSRLRRKIMNALELALVQELPLRDALERVLKALPKKRLVKRDKKLLKPLTVKEADKKEKLPFSFGIVSDDDWNEIVEDYLTDYIPKTRSPETVFDLPDPEGGEELLERYGWELEQEMTDSFVKSVRSGQGEWGAKAKELGIKDFVWIAIIDQKTCENCCEWRNGLTSTEIEAKLKTSHKDDDCKVVSPPAHFNCRCDMAPVLDNMPEVEPSNAQEFEEWLNS